MEITLCENDDCPMRNRCTRYIITVGEAYARFEPKSPRECDYYVAYQDTEYKQ